MWLVNLFHWTNAAKTDLRGIDHEQALNVLRHLTDYGSTGHGDVKRIKGSAASEESSRVLEVPRSYLRCLEDAPAARNRGKGQVGRGLECTLLAADRGYTSDETAEFQLQASEKAAGEGNWYSHFTAKRGRGRSLKNARRSLVVGPHPENFDGSFAFEDLIHKPVLNIDAAGVRSREIADELERWRLVKRVV